MSEHISHYAADELRDLLGHMEDFKKLLPSPDRYPVTIWQRRISELAAELDALPITPEYRWTSELGPSSRWFPGDSRLLQIQPADARLQRRYTTPVEEIDV